jgi:hypothetical protein
MAAPNACRSPFGELAQIASFIAGFVSLATGDRLLHGRHFARQELGGPEEAFRRILRHHYVVEDTTALDRILGQQYDVVVGNPP